MIAVFFLGLNAAIFLAAGTYWLNRSKPGGRTQADLDVAPPPRQNSAPSSNSRRFPARPSILQEESTISPVAEAAAQSSDQTYVQAKNKLKSAWHWMEEKNPELAKKFARQAIDLAPETDVAKEAQTLLDSLE